MCPWHFLSAKDRVRGKVPRVSSRGDISHQALQVCAHKREPVECSFFSQSVTFSTELRVFPNRAVAWARFDLELELPLLGGHSHHSRPLFCAPVIMNATG